MSFLKENVQNTHKKDRFSEKFDRSFFSVWFGKLVSGLVLGPTVSVSGADLNKYFAYLLVHPQLFLRAEYRNST